MYEVIKMSNIYTLKKNKNTALLSIDEDEKKVFVNGSLCDLTQQEYSLLVRLAGQPDKPVSRQDLLRDAWGYLSPGETRTVDVHVQRLRKKLGFSCIETVYRLGYRLCAQAV